MAHGDDTSRARALYFGLALACILFAVYGSLLPFRFRFVPLDQAWTQFLSALRVPPRRISRSDALANLLLFVPIGFALAGSLLAGRRRWPAGLGAALAIVPVSLAVSVAAEFLQIFASRRVPSPVDIMSQTTGTVVGIGAWMAAGPALTAWLRDTWQAPGEDRLSRALAAYAAAWLFVNLAPFDITVDLGDLAARVRSGEIALIPFAGSGVAPARRAWDFTAEFTGAIPLGLLGVAGWTRRSRRGPLEAFTLGAALVLCVEVAQVFISSHSADATDAFGGCLGVALGVWAGFRCLPRGDAARPASEASPVAAWAVALLAAWCILLCAYHWLPYDFVSDGAMIRRKLSRLSFLPFAAYGRGSSLNALKDLLTKLALSVPFGALAAFAVRPGRVSTFVLAPGWLVLAAAIFGTIEAGQLFLPTRVPDVTDVLIGISGTAAGLALGWWVRRH